MKTLELKLKKDVLIVEIPRLADYEFINRECKYLKSKGVLVFIKQPNIMRLCIHPLYSSFQDCYYFAQVLLKM